MTQTWSCAGRFLLLSLFGSFVLPGAAQAATCPPGTSSPCVIRGPYLQVATPSSIVVRWRTDVATDSEVDWGTSASNLNQSVTGDQASPTIEHELTLTGLSPTTKYFYSVGTTAGALSSGADHTFRSAPPVGSPQALRIWATGDFGTAPNGPPEDAQEKKVRDSYAAFTNQYATYTDVWLWLGDNAYVSGSDSQYQKAIFDSAFGYQELVRRTAAWPTIGNHDAAASTNPALTLPYFLNFTLPAGGEAGGQPSGTEKYYSFDYGNVHFVCLDSQTAANRQPGSAMLTWLASDLSSTSQDFTIAYWHHPPYSKGPHVSDTEIELKEMRQNVVPVLEAHGVDLVLSGHSHVYERSFLIDGHYGTHSTWDPSTMGRDLGDGRVTGTGAYRKPTIGPAPHEGTVYVVAGSAGSGCTGNGCNTLDYPAMYISVPPPFSQPTSPLLGSLVIDVKGRRLDATFLRETGVVADSFTIIKGPLPSFSISDATVTEGDTGTKNAVFNVTLDPPADTAVHVDYQTADGTATTADGDYQASAGTLTFPPGVTSRTLSVPVVGDTTPEPSETFQVQLQNPDPGTLIADATGLGTIVDDDVSVFEFKAANVSIKEALGSATITVKRTGGLKTLAMVSYDTSDGTATSAGAQDYAATNGSLTFKPGVLTQTFKVSITKDTLDEPDETVLLSLSNPSVPSLLGPQSTAVLTILDDDVGGHIQLSAAKPKVTEPAVGGAPVPAKITVTRLGGMASGVTVHYDVSGGSATRGADYTPTSGDLTFDATGAGARTKTFTVDVLPDGLPEGTETVNVTLSAPAGGATLGTPNTAVLSILDAQPTFELSATSYSVKETTPSALITVKRSGPPVGTVMVSYATSDGTATSSLDYQAASGTLTFRQGITSLTFKVPILKDTVVEGPETVNLALTQLLGQPPVGAASNATLTIEDVVPLLSFGAATYTASEPASSILGKLITVLRKGSLAGTVTVDYSATGGTATPGPAGVGDYQLTAGTLTFAPGVTKKTFVVAIEPDSAVEGTETVDLALTNVSGAVLVSPSTTVLDILDGP